MHIRRNIAGVDKPLTKGECLASQTHFMIAMRKVLEGYSEAIDSILVARYKSSNVKAMNVKIFNTKIAVEMGMMDKEYKKKKVAELISMK